MTTTAPRRELLLEAAADLFARNGYHGVGIDDIGAAAGISGPGVYRHFASKQALLAALCDRTMDRMLGLAEAATSLEGLVAVHVEFVIESGPMLAVWVRERQALEPAIRRALRKRLLDYQAVWQQVLTPRRPDLSAGEVALVVGAVIAMLNTTALIVTDVPKARRTAVLQDLALRALLPQP